MRRGGWGWQDPLGRPTLRFAAGSKPGDFRIEVLAGADHSFSADHASERANPWIFSQPRSAEQFMPGYLDLMADWMAEQTRSASPG